MSQIETLLENVWKGEFVFQSISSGRQRQCFGSCFPISFRIPINSSQYALETLIVTNRHNIDGAYGLNSPDWKLKGIHLRIPSHPDAGGSFKDISIDPSADIYGDLNSDNDIALIEYKPIVPPGYCSLNLYDNRVIHGIDEIDQKAILPGANIAFIGYPGNLWDMENNFPIVRMANIASVPWLPFKAGNQGFAERILVSGLSLSGSSGSVVFNVESMSILGVMAGHYPKNIFLNAWASDLDLQDAAQSGQSSEILHTGLSFFIKSHIIQNIFDTKNRLNVWI